MKRKRLSAACRHLRQLQEAMDQDLQILFKRGPMLKGRLYQAQTRCGKPGCRCARGELHTATVLAYRGGQKQQNRCPADQDTLLLGKMTDRYREFRQARARWVKAAKAFLEQLEVIELERLAQGEEKFRTTETGKSVP